MLQATQPKGGDHSSESEENDGCMWARTETLELVVNLKTRQVLATREQEAGVLGG